MSTKLKHDVHNSHVEKPKNDRFPIIVMVIIIAEFCERFSYSGMKAFLTLYLKSKLMYSDDEATEIYHIFTSLIYCFPILGAIVADNYLGKFRTIVWMMLVYAMGNTITALTAVPQLGMPGRCCTLIGLLLISIGAGGIKPCVAAFGGDQFELPRQEKHLALYFSVLYFALCFGSLIAKTISPILRSEIQCFGDKDCYSVAFGAPGIIMLISIVIFAGAKQFYLIKKPTGNVILEFVKCIMLGVKNKFKSRSSSEQYNHWLDSAQDVYDPQFIRDVKNTLKILIIYIPLPVFWALLDQMGSRWTLQATRMTGDFYWCTIRPDQMQVLAPLLIMCIIPLFQKVVYPCFNRLNWFTNPLQKLTLGGVLAGVALLISGCLEIHLQKSYPQLPQEKFSQMRIFNGLACPLSINNSEENIFATIAPYSLYVNKHIRVDISRNITLDIECECREIKEKVFLLEENEAFSFYFNEANIWRFKDDISKSRSGYPLVRFLTNGRNKNISNIILFNERRQESEITITNDGASSIYEVFPSQFTIIMNNNTLKKYIEFKTGGVYAIIINHAQNHTFVSETIITTEPNSISMLLLIPQFVIMAIAEVLFAVTGLEFSFKEAPDSMKSVLQACWLLTEAFGNIIIIIITRLAVRCDQATQSFIYTGLILVAMLIFYFLAERYDFANSKQECTNKINKYPELRKKQKGNNDILYSHVKQREERSEQ